MHYLKKFFSFFLPAVIGSLITHFFNRRRDKKIDDKKEKDELFGIGNLVCFLLALQQSELVKLKKDIEARILNFETQKSFFSERDKIIQITQDFSLCEEINVDIKDSCKIILLAGKNARGIIEELQSVFISNRKYIDFIKKIKNYHEFKRALSSNQDATNSIIQFLDSNLKSFKEIASENLSFNQKTLTSFKRMMFEKFKIKINISTSRVPIKLN